MAKKLSHLELVIMLTQALTDLEIKEITKLEGDTSKIVRHIAQQAYDHGVATTQPSPTDVVTLHLDEPTARLLQCCLNEFAKAHQGIDQKNGERIYNMFAAIERAK